jgi:1-acyl-sn-glycerol-3-phosphate acyltransferase
MITYRVVVAILHALYRLLGFRIEVQGAHLLPATGPVVVAANHVSHLDPVHLGISITRQGRVAAFLAKRELFEQPVRGRLLRAMGQIEVDRGGRAADSLQSAEAALRRGHVVAVFPEGTISTSFVPCPPRSGAARLALTTGSPIVPVAVWGGQRVLTKGRSELKPPFLRTRGVVMTVRFGAPVIPRPDEDPAHLMARAWEAVGRLVEQSARSYPQAPSGPADTWWVPAHLDGTAPTPEEALRLRAEEAEARRARRSAETAA